MAQDKLHVPAPAVQGEDFRLEVVLMAVTGKDIQGDPRRKRRELPFPPVEQQSGGVRLHQKAAVVQKRDPHQRNFTAVP